MLAWRRCGGLPWPQWGERRGEHLAALVRVGECTQGATGTIIRNRVRGCAGRSSDRAPAIARAPRIGRAHVDPTRDLFCRSGTRCPRTDYLLSRTRYRGAARLPLGIAVIAGSVGPVAGLLGFAGRLIWPAVPEREPWSEHESRLDRSLGQRVSLGVLTGITAVAAYGALHVLTVHTPNDIPGVAAALLAGLGVAWLAARRAFPGAGRWWTIDAARFMPAPVFVLVVTALFAWGFGQEQRYQGTLYDYCAYGAVSQAQLTGCLDHVTTDRISQLNTDAARFAQGALSQCLADAGPFCAAAANQEQLQNQAAGAQSP